MLFARARATSAVPQASILISRLHAGRRVGFRPRCEGHASHWQSHGRRDLRSADCKSMAPSHRVIELFLWLFKCKDECPSGLFLIVRFIMRDIGFKVKAFTLTRHSKVIIHSLLDVLMRESPELSKTMTQNIIILSAFMSRNIGIVNCSMASLT